MTRLSLTFVCHGCTLGATLDTARGTTGLLIVTGGKELRTGPFDGQAQLAARIADAGYPVFRFDRRGIGDSEGEDPGFAHSQDDIRSAQQAFRALSPQLTKVVGWGNCDGASALMLGAGCELDGLVLSNPWTVEDEDMAALPPAAAIRRRYATKLKNPREVLRLMSGKVDYRKLIRGVAKGAARSRREGKLVDAMREGLSAYDGPARILLADADRTAQIFAEKWDQSDERVRHCPGATHAFVEPEARRFLESALLEALAR